MLNDLGNCSVCGYKRFIVNKKHGLCDECNYIRLHGTTKKHKPIKYTYKPTGERELFLEIWNERPHFCEEGANCINAQNGKGVYLGEEPKTFFFSHEKSKGAHGELRLSKKNIKLRCWDCHTKHDCK